MCMIILQNHWDYPDMHNYTVCTYVNLVVKSVRVNFSQSE